MPARIRIQLTPPLYALAQDAEAVGLGVNALLSAEVHRARTLARRAARDLALPDDVRDGVLHTLSGMEQADIIAGIDDLPSAERIAAEMVDAGLASRSWLASAPSPVAIWGLIMEARRG